MRKVFVLLLFLSAPSFAARKPDVVACSAALITANICNSGDVVLIVPIIGPTAVSDVSIADYAASGNYQATLPCQQERKLDGRILEIAGVTQGDCSSGQIGTTIANPQTKPAFAAALAQKDLRDRVMRWRRQVASVATVPVATEPSE